MLRRRGLSVYMDGPRAQASEKESMSPKHPISRIASLAAASLVALTLLVGCSPTGHKRRPVKPGSSDSVAAPTDEPVREQTSRARERSQTDWSTMLEELAVQQCFAWSPSTGSVACQDGGKSFLFSGLGVRTRSAEKAKSVLMQYDFVPLDVEPTVLPLKLARNLGVESVSTAQIGDTQVRCTAELIEEWTADAGPVFRYEIFARTKTCSDQLERRILSTTLFPAECLVWDVGSHLILAAVEPRLDPLVEPDRPEELGAGSFARSCAAP